MEQTQIQRRAVSPKTVAELIDASLPFVRNEIRDRKLKAKRLGRKIIVLMDDLDEYLRSQPNY